MITPDFYRYEVLFTPLVYHGEYGETIDVTKDVNMVDYIKNVDKIKQDIDNGDYDIGIFTFGNITLKCVNFNGKFNDATDYRSIFPFKRDLCKVKISFFDADNTESIKFEGLINDDASRTNESGTDEDFSKNEVRFKVLSKDSIFRQTNVQAGSIADGVTSKTALDIILNQPEITNILNYNASNVNLDYNAVIDDGEYFSNLTVKEALDEILLVCNSILIIDSSDNIIIKSRVENTTTWYLYGAGDEYGRENILSFKNYNTGVQRAFSSIKFEDNVAQDDAYIELYGFSQKEINVDFITNTSTRQDIIDNILLDWKAPKQEIEVTVPASEVAGIQMLDKVSVNFPNRVISPKGASRTTMYEVGDKYGEVKYNRQYGSIEINPDIKFKVIAITERPSKMQTTLKLRQAGTTLSDGYF